MPKISVIIPIYNQEKFLNKVLDSISQQTFTDYEVLLINDGSTDNSSEICMNHCRNNNKMQLMNKTNEGVSSARQMGLELVKGEYVIHIDPDDYVEPDFLECLYEEIIHSGADMAVCDYWEEFSDRKTLCTHNMIISSSPQELMLNIVDGNVWGVCWNKLIRTECVKNKVRFEPGINFHEDKLFIVRSLRNLTKVVYIRKPLYHYNRRNPSSLVINTKLSKDTIKQIWKVNELIISEEDSPGVRFMLSQKVITIGNILILWLNREFTQREYLKLIEPIKDYVRKKIYNSKDTSLILRILLMSSTYMKLNHAKVIVNKIMSFKYGC